MRIWDVPPSCLCRQHLLGEHRELHALYTILLDDKKVGYRNHPETKRWVGKLPALYKRHELLVKEMTKRGYKHNSLLAKTKGLAHQDVLLQSVDEQIRILKEEKQCACPLDNTSS